MSPPAKNGAERSGAAAAEEADPSLVRVGSRVSIYWPAENRFYDGTVTRKHRGRGRKQFLVEYDDGDTEWANFETSRFRFLVGRTNEENEKNSSEVPEKTEKDESTEAESPNEEEDAPSKEADRNEEENSLESSAENETTIAESTEEEEEDVSKEAEKNKEENLDAVKLSQTDEKKLTVDKKEEEEEEEDASEEAERNEEEKSEDAEAPYTERAKEKESPEEEEDEELRMRPPTDKESKEAQVQEFSSVQQQTADVRVAKRPAQTKSARTSKKKRNELTRILPGYTAPMGSTLKRTSMKALLDKARRADSALAVQRALSQRRGPAATMTATPVSAELRRDLAVIRHRHYLDPKRFYKKADQPGRIQQIGTVIAGPFEGRESRYTVKEQKRSLTEQVMGEFPGVKEKFKKMQQEKTAKVAARKKKKNRAKW
jgi:hypothetical protein